MNKDIWTYILKGFYPPASTTPSPLRPEIFPQAGCYWKFCLPCSKEFLVSGESGPPLPISTKCSDIDGNRNNDYYDNDDDYDNYCHSDKNMRYWWQR